MAASKLLSGYKGLGGTAKRVLNEKTGEILSRRQYAQVVKRGGLLTNEQLATVNKNANRKAQLLRPTKNRTSALKLSPAIAEDVARARQEELERKAREQKQAKEQQKIASKIERAKGRRVQVKKISTRLLKPGHMGRRIPFNDYDDYVSLFEQGKKVGPKYIAAYGIGVQGVDVRSGSELDATVWRMRLFDKLIPRDKFDASIADFLSTRPYFLMSNLWMHLAFAIAYVREKAANAPKKKSRKKRK